MNRFDARENAFSAIFCGNFQKELLPDDILELYLQSKSMDTDEYFELLIRTVYQNLIDIDALIENNLNNWSLERISNVSLAAMRIAIAEMKYIEDTPRLVAINEAVEIAKKYEGVKCGQFVNGVLSAILKEL